MKFSAKEPGLLLSGATHTALILWGLFALAAPKPFDEFAEATPIDIISDSQFQELIKGDPKEKQALPNAPRRIDRIAKVEEDREPGQARTNVPAPPPPPLRPDVKDAAEETDAPAPPAPAPPAPVPPAPAPKVAALEPPPAPPPPARPVEPPRPEPKPEPKKQAMSAPAKATSTEEDEEEEEAEIIRERQKKLDAEKAAEARRADETRKAEEARREEARKRTEREKEEAIRRAAEAQRLDDARKEEARKEEARREEARKEEARKEEARKLAERREAQRLAALERQREEEEERREEEREKAAELKKAADAQKAAERQKLLDEQKKKAAETARKLAEAKKAEDARKAAEKAETDKLNAAIRNRLLASQGAAASSGSTGQQVVRTASAGAPNATGQKLSPSEKGELAGLIKEQMERCWSVTTTTVPAVKPLVRLQLGPNGAIIAAPALLNGGDSSFQAIADSGMRAIRQCSPYRIPARFADKYQDWKTITVKLDPSDLL